MKKEIPKRAMPRGQLGPKVFAFPCGTMRCHRNSNRQMHCMMLGETSRPSPVTDSYCNWIIVQRSQSLGQRLCSRASMNSPISVTILHHAMFGCSPNFRTPSHSHGPPSPSAVPKEA